MTKTKSTKRALLMSALSLLMCVSMLIGSTFAWFTDSVSSMNNIIKSGNLDVELEYYDGDSWEKVTATTNVFEENTLWEPGHTEVVNLRVSNLGTLALKYNLGINIVSEIESINVAGENLRLSDYIMFGAIEDVETPYADRAAARAAVTEAKALSTGYTNAGSIEAGADAEYVALVVYMPETVGNEANYRTGEVAPEITLGLNLMATQYTSESDSFNNQYDADAMFSGIPAANVTTLSKMPTVITINNNTEVLDCAYVFTTTETYEQAQKNAHRFWHADFVASFDQDVNDAAIGLAGAYDNYNNGEWLAFELEGLMNGGVIKANQPVRMLETAGISMNYEELCSLVKKFSCGAFACDGKEAELAGKTMTVELRLYETTGDPNTDSGSKNIETGEYITVGTYSYTFPGIAASNQTELLDAIADGAGAVQLSAGNYTMPETNLQGKTLAIRGTKNTVIDASKVDTRNQFVTGADLVFDGVTLNFSNGQKIYMGFANVKSLTFKNCHITGMQMLMGGNVTFENCVLDSSANTGEPHAVWTYGAKNVSFTNCDFIYGNRAINCYKDQDIEGGKQVVNFKNCTFTTTDTNSEGAVEINSCFFSVGIEVNMEGCTAPANGPMAYVSPWDSTNGAKTTINIQ